MDCHQFHAPYLAVSQLSVLCQSGQCALSVWSVCFDSHLSVLCQSAQCAIPCCGAVSVALQGPRKKTTIIIITSFKQPTWLWVSSVCSSFLLLSCLCTGQEKRPLSSSSSASNSLPGCGSARCAAPSCC